MSKFNEGDRVQVREGNASYGTEHWSGVGTITMNTVEGYVIVLFDISKIKGGFLPAELERAEENDK